MRASLKPVSAPSWGRAHHPLQFEELGGQGQLCSHTLPASLIKSHALWSRPDGPPPKNLGILSATLHSRARTMVRAGSRGAGGG